MPPSATAPAHDGELLERVVFEIKRVIVGQDRLVERMLVGLLARGHLLLEGVPGVAKTLAVETVARVVGGTFARLQFTPDLVPADILGTRIYRQGREEFDVELGPVVANFVLADEINRAPAKVQSAMLEVMAERHVSIGGQHLPDARPVPRARHPEPDRERGRLPAARGAARPLPLQDHRGLPGAGGGARDRLPDGRRAAGRAAGASSPTELVAAAGRRVARVRPPCARRLRGAAGGRHAHARRARAGRRRGLGRLRRVAARHPRHRRARPGRWRWSAAATTCCPRTCSTSRRTCCGTGWCCPTTRWPTRCRSTTSSAGCWRPSRCRRSPPVRRRPPAGRLHPGRCRDGHRDQAVVTAPAPPGGAAHPGRQEGHLEDVRRPEPGSPTRGAPHRDRPPSLRDGRIEAALRSLELTVRGRLDGLLQGNHLGLVPGPGSEPGEARIYQPGDDVRRMDWAVTARTTLPHVRQTVADRELETWVVDGPVAQPGLRHGRLREARPRRRRARGRHPPDRGAAATGSA